MIGERLYDLRKDAGMTQDEIATKLGVSRASVNKWETGKIKIKPAYLFAFCYLTGFKANDIFLPN